MCRCVFLQLRAEFEIIIPEAARGKLLRVEWHIIRDKVIEVAKKKSKGHGVINDLLSRVQDEFAEGLKTVFPPSFLRDLMGRSCVRVLLH
jgi:hypothetical protein